MKLVIIEPLGVEKDKLLSIARNALKDSVEIVYYDTKTTDTQELIERGKDAEIIVVANNPLNAEVINGCKKLKLLSVAFTGIDHIPWMHARQMVSLYATVQDIPLQQFRILYLAC